MFTIIYQDIKLKVEITEDKGQTIYRLIWPDDSRKFLFLGEDAKGNPKWQYLAGESPKEAKEIGKLVEQQTL